MNLALHVLLSLFAMTLLILGLGQAILLGLQHYFLKRQPSQTLLRILPPLQRMEQGLFTIITCAVLLFSLALGSGFLFHQTFADFHLISKVVLAISAWILLMILLIGRFYFGWRGTTAVKWTCGGVFLAFLSYFGTKLLLV